MITWIFKGLCNPIYLHFRSEYDGLRKGLTKLGPSNFTIPTFESMMDSRSLFLTANANTAYTWIWINLHEGPLVSGSSTHDSWYD